VIQARTTSVDDTRSLAAAVAPLAKPGDLLLLAGDLGAGKTSFVQGFARGLGVTEPVTSPAFVLARPYHGRLPLLHLDVYRLEHLQELQDLGISELLDDGNVTVIEWGDVVASALPADFLEVRMSPGATDDERFLTLRWVGSNWPARAAALRRAVAGWAPPGGSAAGSAGGSAGGSASGDRA
jgi:tRNA threonylcarbamoyladenosine biosynthesis protein TsaE